MPTLDTLKEADFTSQIDASSRRKARGYLPRVKNGVRRGERLTAEVRGSSLYEVEIDLTTGHLEARCSCPYNWGGYCKHVGAVLYKWLESPGSFMVETAVSPPPPSGLETTPVPPPPSQTPSQAPAWYDPSFSKRQANGRQQLRRSLENHKVQDLRQMAKKQGWSVSGTRKDDIISQIMEQMFQPGAALQSVNRLDNEHRQILRALALFHSDIGYKEEQLKEVATGWGPLTKYKKISTYTGNLIGDGLALPGSFNMAHWQALPFIPAPLLQELPPLLADIISPANLPDHSQSQLQPANPQSFMRSAMQILLLLEQTAPSLRPPMPRPRLEKFHTALAQWDYLPEEILELLAGGKLKGSDPSLTLTVPPPALPLGDETVNKLAPLAGDEARLGFIYQLLVTAGLLQPGSPVTVWQKMKEQFFRRPETGQWVILARSYFTMTDWSEVWLLLQANPDLRLKRSLGYYSHLPPRDIYQKFRLFRQQVLRVLACLPDNQWVALDDLLAVLRPMWRQFDHWAWERSSGAYGPTVKPLWFLEENGRFLDTTKNQADWQTAQGGFVQQMLLGPLHWLGLTDLSMENGQLVAFRLHGLADLYWDRVEEREFVGGETAVVSSTQRAPAKPKPGAFVTDQLIHVNPATISAQAHNYLDQIAKIEETSSDRFTYRLNAAAVHQTFESGATLDQLLAQWKKHLGIPMPDTIRQPLEGWWSAYGLVRLYENVSLIEFGDEYALREMKAVTSLEKHLVAEITPTLVFIQPQAIPTLIAELEKAGYTPKQTDKVS
jgi:hypothetical protein